MAEGATRQLPVMTFRHRQHSLRACDSTEMYCLGALRGSVPPELVNGGPPLGSGVLTSSICTGVLYPFSSSRLAPAAEPRGDDGHVELHGVLIDAPWAGLPGESGNRHSQLPNSYFVVGPDVGFSAHEQFSAKVHPHVCRWTGIMRSMQTSGWAAREALQSPETCCLRSGRRCHKGCFQNGV